MSEAQQAAIDAGREAAERLYEASRRSPEFRDVMDAAVTAIDELIHRLLDAGS